METDHKSLIPLFNKPNGNPPLRIERWVLYLQQFDFESRYCPGKDNAAYYLSGHAIQVSATEGEKVYPEAPWYIESFKVPFQSLSL